MLMEARMLAVVACVLLLSVACAQTITWQQAKPMPVGKGGQVCGVVQGKVLVAGGTHWIDGETKVWSRDLYVYDPQQDTWSTGPEMPVALSYGTGGAIGDRLYVVSGSDGVRDYADVWICEPTATGYRWLRGPSLPAPRIYGASAVIGTRLFVFGGADGNALSGELYDDVVMLDTARLEDGWQVLGQMPGAGRTLMTAAAVGTRVYLFGGYMRRGEGFANSRDALVFDAGSGSRGRVPHMPWAPRCADAIAVGEQVYLLGGYVEWRGTADVDEGFTDRILRFDSERGTYTDAGKLPIPNCGMTPQLLPDGRIFVCGGEDEKKHRTDLTAIGTLQ